MLILNHLLKNDVRVWTWNLNASFTTCWMHSSLLSKQLGAEPSRDLVRMYILVQRMDSRARLSQLETQLQHVLAMWPGDVYLLFVLQFPPLQSSVGVMSQWVKSCKSFRKVIQVKCYKSVCNYYIIINTRRPNSPQDRGYSS